LCWQIVFHAVFISKSTKLIHTRLANRQFLR
jgi:hypothetical protein